MPGLSGRLAIASLSARALLETAHGEGYRPIALDLFGDADTRRAAEAWLPIGDSSRLAIDPPALLAALRQLRGEGGVAGWIAGSGFDGRPGLLAAGSRILPLFGNRAQTVARVRHPATFFARLTALGIPHPATRPALPLPPSGWLRKDAAGCGGWQVRPAAMRDRRTSPSVYYQRVAPGRPMSALFLAAGGRSRLLGINLQIARRVGGRPYVFHGCVGPVELPPAARGRLAEWLDLLAADFGLRGLNGLDFLFDGERIAVLELNPRPPASLALYRGALAEGLVGAHLAACVDGRLPERLPGRRAGPQRGFTAIFTSQPCVLGPAAVAGLAALPWCHDLPAAPLSLGPGEPVCTVSAEAGSAAAVFGLLEQRRRQITFLLEKSNDACSSPPVLGVPAGLECQ